MNNNLSLPQNIKLGILGGGQLGLMTLQKAMDWGIDTYILDPNNNAPCSRYCKKFHIGSLNDYDKVYQFGKQCDIITIEIENVNVEALKVLEKEGKKVFPQPNIIELIQDKRKQKQFFKKNNIPTAPFELIENKQDIYTNLGILPAVNKLAKEGYDGRGVQKILSQEDIKYAFDKPGVLEKLIDIEKEIAIIIARNEIGQIATFPLVELVFDPNENLLDYLITPSILTEELIESANTIAHKIISSLDMVGILAVEMFLTKDGHIIVNELAPRTHNSGHHTIEANATSQFEQHLRSILNLPLGDTTARMPSAMLNLLGSPESTGNAQYMGIETILNTPEAHLHIYGKLTTKPYRKMGHITILDRQREKLLEKINIIKNNIQVIS